MDNSMNLVDISHNKKIIHKEKEIIRFYYFSEQGICGDDRHKHQEYCNNMLKHGYTLTNMTTMGNLDNHRDSYEGTIIYHWKLAE